MILLLAALALADDCIPTVAVTRLQAFGSREDYLCIIGADDGATLLTAEIAKGGPDERLTRALAMWLLQRTDKPMDPALVEKLSPEDRRLLADGIRARRGRASPAADHVKVFQQFGWYAPVTGYTDARLRPVDRENLAVVDPQVRPTPPPPEATPPAPPPPDAKAAEPVTGQTPNLCGCASDARELSGLAALFGAIALVARRRR